ncbi:hypothetical protein C900_05564 [Fulvivirga imtechensis AK7]|uniref:Outer membrane protein beta-barrel domain-containing protein n=1 Tax=Fulvivirga imtechensis AK7 TaxID=1237149 RepID=L8JJC6_9BACT|nr:hypothetical protein [Fulvivirga imtechensis]ELR69006.1 hypothetical protein C900_05564 [Fulvivirga imtechensis AK7]
MKKIFLSLLLSLFVGFNIVAQGDTEQNYQNFPIVLTLQFHAFAMPFQSVLSNFSNVGIGIGTEVSMNGSHEWVQQLNLMWYRNRAIGNGVMLYTQAAWRPEVVSDAYGELKLGAGYLLSFRPAESYKQANGQWISAGRKGKGMLTIPLGVSMGYKGFSSDAFVSSFISYQFMLVRGYNASIPLVPETIVQVGTAIQSD